MLYEGVTVINGLFSTTGEGYIPPNARMEPVNVGKLTMTQWGTLDDMR